MTSSKPRWHVEGVLSDEVEGATINQPGENVMPAWSVVALPSRDEERTPAQRSARARD